MTQKNFAEKWGNKYERSEYHKQNVFLNENVWNAKSPEGDLNANDTVLRAVCL